MALNEETTISRLVRELREETDDLQESLENLAAEDYDLATPAQGWDIGDSLAHLAFFDAVATQAIEDPRAFADLVSAAEKDPHYFDAPTRELRAMGASRLCEEFAKNRSQFIEAAIGHSGGRVRWFGPPMSTETMVTARQMETFAHGVDIRDAIGEPVFISARHLNVVYLGYRTIGFAFLNHGLATPASDMEIIAVMPDGSEVGFGHPTLDENGEENRVRGSLGDLALLVVQRRHRLDLDLEVTGSFSRRWVEIAQAYAGPPGEGRRRSKSA